MHWQLCPPVASLSQLWYAPHAVALQSPPPWVTCCVITKDAGNAALMVLPPWPRSSLLLGSDAWEIASSVHAYADSRDRPPTCTVTMRGSSLLTSVTVTSEPHDGHDATTSAANASGENVSPTSPTWLTVGFSSKNMSIT